MADPLSHTSQGYHNILDVFSELGNKSYIYKGIADNETNPERVVFIVLMRSREKFLPYWLLGSAFCILSLSLG